MKNNFLQKIASLLLTVSLLLPLGISFSHALHDHDHNICNSKTEKHIHTQKIDCSFFHYFSNVQYNNVEFDFSFFVPNFINSAQTLLKYLHSTSNIFSYLVRGPPTINAF